LLLTATKIHDGHSWLPAGAVIETNNDGTVVAIHSELSSPDIQFFNGILVPGFVNAHCHLELSHLKGKIEEHTGLIGFLQRVMKLRTEFSDEQLRIAPRHEAFEAMYNNGIVAVGDIANTTDTLDLRAKGQIHFHTFLESLGFTETPQKQFAHIQDVYDAFAGQQNQTKKLRQSIVPHAPYSVSHVLFGMIDRHNENALISIHNQETPAEDEYYLIKQGGVQTLLHSIGINDDFFRPSGKSSLQTYLGWMSASHPFMFVHNTYTKLPDIETAQTLLPQVSWCLCPNANLYIENTLPDIDMFAAKAQNICIGTDSLSSNHQLCILSELTTIKKHYPSISWETLFTWGTYNGAVALQMQDNIGSIEPGKQPGILHIQNIESHQPTVKRIL
jgi:cytosine/adenosine deaminase-related metal-dependent hydrolase